MRSPLATVIWSRHAPRFLSNGKQRKLCDQTKQRLRNGQQQAQHRCSFLSRKRRKPSSLYIIVPTTHATSVRVWFPVPYHCSTKKLKVCTKLEVIPELNQSVIMLIKIPFRRSQQQDICKNGWSYLQGQRCCSLRRAQHLPKLHTNVWKVSLNLVRNPGQQAAVSKNLGTRLQYHITPISVKNCEKKSM